MPIVPNLPRGGPEREAHRTHVEDTAGNDKTREAAGKRPHALQRAGDPGVTRSVHEDEGQQHAQSASADRVYREERHPLEALHKPVDAEDRTDNVQKPGQQEVDRARHPMQADDRDQHDGRSQREQGLCRHGLPEDAADGLDIAIGLGNVAR